MTAFKLALRELRSGVRGFGVFLACLALGVAAIAGVAMMTSFMSFLATCVSSDVALST